MTKTDFYRVYIEDRLKKHDKPFNRQLWNDTIDFCHKEGLITECQAYIWVYPQTEYFV